MTRSVSFMRCSLATSACTFSSVRARSRFATSPVTCCARWQALCENNRELVEAHRAAYMETAIEDDEIAERTDAGRRALYQRGIDDSGPYQIPLEEGMQHFHGWYRQVMGQALAAQHR